MKLEKLRDLVILFSLFGFYSAFTAILDLIFCHNPLLIQIPLIQTTHILYLIAEQIALILAFSFATLLFIKSIFEIKPKEKNNKNKKLITLGGEIMSKRLYSSEEVKEILEINERFEKYGSKKPGDYSEGLTILEELKKYSEFFGEKIEELKSALE
jgi:hypothetical protein